MSSTNQAWEYNPVAPVLAAGMPNWYAVHTRSRHERMVAHRLSEQGVTHFLPLITEVRHWSDRRKLIELPLFSCYLFVRIPYTNEERLRVRRIDGVVDFVGVRGVGTPIPDTQIEAVQTLLTSNVAFATYPFLKVGQRVRIRGGALDGVEGIFLSCSRDRTLVISVDAIQRSMAVRIEGYDVEPL